MSTNNFVYTNLNIVNELINKIISGEEIHPLELEILKDAIKYLYIEALKVQTQAQKENLYDNDVSSDEKIMPSFIDEKKEESVVEFTSEDNLLEEKEDEEEIDEEEMKKEIEKEEVEEEKIVTEDNPSEKEVEKIIEGDLFTGFLDKVDTAKDFDFSFDNERETEIREEVEITIDDIISEEGELSDKEIYNQEIEIEVTTEEIITNREVEVVKETLVNEEIEVIEEEVDVFEQEEIIDESEEQENKTVTIAEKLSIVTSTIADSIVTENKSTVADKVSKEKISNIKLAIGINDKFFFINRLFDGDVNFYNETIDKFNNFSSLNDAKILLQLLINKYDWDFEDEAYKKFEDIIERRY